MTIFAFNLYFIGSKITIFLLVTHEHTWLHMGTQIAHEFDLS